MPIPNPPMRKLKYLYTDDNSNVWLVTLTTDMANNGGFALAGEAETFVTDWPFPNKYLRHVWVTFPNSNPPRKSMFIPCPNPYVQMYTKGGSFVVSINREPVNCKVSTMVGETRPVWRLPWQTDDSTPI
jgi:hypothetical protein